MTIKFYCPSCGALIGFEDKHIGKQGSCFMCGQTFIIPSKDYEEAKIVEEQEEAAEPIPGFWRAAFLDSWKIFLRPANAAGMVFIAAAVCFKFFTGHTDYSFDMGQGRFQAPVGQIVTAVAWGCLFWYYMEIISSAAFDFKELPESELGGLFGLIWNVVKSVFIFAMALFLVELPCIIFISILRKAGVNRPIILHILANAGLFFFPMVIMIYSVEREVTEMVRLVRLFRWMTHSFWPYLAVVGLFVLAWELQLSTAGYSDLAGKGKVVVGLGLLANLGVQVIAVVTMRSMGLFYRHFYCYLQK